MNPQQPLTRSGMMDHSAGSLPEENPLEILSREINTPLGVALTASTNLEDLVASFRESLTDSPLTEAEILDYLSDLAASARLVTRGIQRASEVLREQVHSEPENSQGELFITGAYGRFA